MSAINRSNISDAELEVLKSLWKQGPGTVRDLENRLKRKKWAYTTILTLLSRLREKGHVVQDRETGGPAHLFRAAMTQRELLGMGMRELAQRVGDGMASPMVHALVEGGRLTAAEIAELRRMLDDLERKGGK